MFAAPNIRDVEAQQASQQQPQYMQSNDPKLISSTTTTTYSNPAQQSGGQYVQNTSQQGMMTGGQNGVPAGTVEPKTTLVRMAHSLEWGSLMLLVAFFSLMLMIAAAQACDNGNSNCLALQGYQVAVATISMIIAFFFGVGHLLEMFESVVYRSWVSLFLFLWWIAGVIVLTFIGDFTSTTRAAGYFSTWFAFGFSALSLINISESIEFGFDKTMHSVRKPLFFLVISSLVAMGASIGPCSPRSACYSYNAYAVVVSVVSLFFSLILFFWPAALERAAMTVFAWFFVIWWVFGAAVTTLGGPFFIAGNGFFAVYGALISSCALLAVLKRQARGTPAQ